MNWYIGQEIVCLKPHFLLKKGLLYGIHSLRQCQCGVIEIDVAVKIPDRKGSGRFSVQCGDCRLVRYSGTDDTCWFHEERFALLADISELKEILEKQPEKINI